MKLQSYTITQGRDRAPARAMLKAIGFTDEDLAKPIIGVANTWIETMPCNYNLRALAVQVKEGIRAAGGTPMEFNTIAISDGVTMGTEGMKTSLVSREVIADSIELLVRGHMFDGVVALVACDKTIPGAAMACCAPTSPAWCSTAAPSCPASTRARHQHSAMFSRRWAPTRRPHHDAELLDIEDHACPGAGACGGQFTANTMATVMELIGLCPMGMAAVPQVDKRKDDVARRCGQIIMNAVRNNLRRATSARARLSTTPSPAWPPREAPPTPCCTCWPWRAKPKCRFPSTISTPSAPAPRSSSTSNPAAASWPPTWIRPAALG
jgi:dihydroxy-acid dehydratase